MKLYVDEAGTAQVQAGADEADAVAIVRVTYAEARVALARHRRDGALTPSQLRPVVADLDRDWATYNVIDVTETVVRTAGALAERHALRGYDAVQLASALEVRAAGGTVALCSFDGRLSRAARREHLSARGEVRQRRDVRDLRQAAQ